MKDEDANVGVQVNDGTLEKKMKMTIKNPRYSRRRRKKYNPKNLKYVPNHKMRESKISPLLFLKKKRHLFFTSNAFFSTFFYKERGNCFLLSQNCKKETIP